MPEESMSRDRLTASPGAVYARTFKEPAYEFKRTHFFDELISTHEAWTVMLVDVGLVPEGEAGKILDSLAELSEAGPEALGSYEPSQEYFYSHVEAYISEPVGEDIAGNINIARTRPEPLARMVTREYVLETLDMLNTLRRTFLDIAEQEAATVMPQWTHYQHAQIATIGHYCVAIADNLARSVQRLFNAYEIVDSCTLGCGALAGTSYPIDRDLAADLLGFDDVKENALDCVAGGDHLTSPATALADGLVTLSRVAEDFYTWHTREFDLVEVTDEFAGSSSMMPQKKNVYFYETIRSRAAHVASKAFAIYETLHNTNFQDVKDVEDEGVYPLFEAFDVANRTIELLDASLQATEFNREAMAESAAEGFGSSTELAAEIHRETDLSYRTAHRVVGRTVLIAMERGLVATEVDAELVDEAAEAITGTPINVADPVVESALNPEAFVESHTSRGGTAPSEVRRAVDDRRASVTEDEEHRQRLEDRIDDANERLRKRVDALR